MDEKKYLDGMFDQYVQTQELKELKEEVLVNLRESIRDNLKKGFSREEAIQKSIESLGNIEQILSGYPKKKNQIWKWLYYISCVCIVAGICMAVITFVDNRGWNGAFLAIGIFYPFAIVQTAYIIWYKAGAVKFGFWNTVSGIASCITLFFLLNIFESSFRMIGDHTFELYGWNTISGEIALSVLGAAVTLYAIVKNKSKCGK